MKENGKITAGAAEEQEHIDRFIKQNPSIDLKTISLTQKHHLESFRWADDRQDKKDQVLAALKKYQRVLRLVDDKAVAQKLLVRGIHSAYQIASLSERVFLEKYEQLFASQEKARQTYKKARQKSMQTAFYYLHKKEKSSPYVKAARLLKNP